MALFLLLFQCVLTLLMAICVMHPTTDYVISKRAVHFSQSIFFPMLGERDTLHTGLLHAHACPCGTTQPFFKRNYSPKCGWHLLVSQQWPFCSIPEAWNYQHGSR